MSNNGKTVIATLVDNLNGLGLSNVVATPNHLYRSSDFLEKGSVSLISKPITSKYQNKISKHYNNQLCHTKLTGCPCEMSESKSCTIQECIPSTTITRCSLKIL